MSRHLGHLLRVHPSRRGPRRWLSSALVAAVMAGAFTLTASPANAATTIQVTCTEQSITIYGSVGDEFTFSGSGACNSDWEFINQVDYSNNPAPGWLAYVSHTNMAIGNTSQSPDRWWRYYETTRPSSVTAQLIATTINQTPLVSGSTIAHLDNDASPNGRTITIPIIYGGPSAPASPTALWTVVRQGLPVPADGTCTSVADAEYAWGTGLSGGWVKAWEPWVDGGKGGWACNRSLVNRGTTWMVDNSV